jgi:hypothetical protein
MEGNNKDSYNEKYIKGDYYINRITQLLDEIDELEKLLTQDKRLILDLHSRIHALYKQIAIELTPEELQIQRKIMQKLKEHKQKMIITRRTVNNDYKVVNITNLHPEHYYKFKYWLEKRQIHINKILKRIGFLTTQTKKQLY